MGKKSAKLNHPVYIKDSLTSEWVAGNMLHWGGAFDFISTEEEKLWIPSKLIQIRNNRGRPPEDLGDREEKGD